MIASRTDARDRILSPLKDVVDTYSLYAIYDDTVRQPPEDGSSPWVRIQVRHRAGVRASLGRADGKGKHDQTGFIFIEIYTPREDGLTDSDQYSAAFAEKLRKFPDGDIWIVEVVATEVGDDGNWYRVDVIADFEYDLIQ